MSVNSVLDRVMPADWAGHKVCESVWHDQVIEHDVYTNVKYGKNNAHIKLCLALCKQFC